MVAWIWKVTVHPRMLFFLWKVSWNCLPTRVLLRDRDMDLPVFGLICNLKDGSTKYALLHCARARLIWRMVSSPT